MPKGARPMHITNAPIARAFCAEGAANNTSDPWVAENPPQAKPVTAIAKRHSQ